MTLSAVMPLVTYDVLLKALALLPHQRGFFHHLRASQGSCCESRPQPRDGPHR